MTSSIWKMNLHGSRSGLTPHVINFIKSSRNCDLLMLYFLTQMMESEFEKVHPSLAAIVTLFDQFEQFAEDSALDEAKESYEELKERWQSAIQSLAARSRTIAVSKFSQRPSQTFLSFNPSRVLKYLAFPFVYRLKNRMQTPILTCLLPKLQLCSLNSKH